MQPLQFLERHLGSYTVSRHEALFHCPFCKHHKPKLSVNTDTWFWKCWVCDKRGRNLFGLFWVLGDPHLTRAFRSAFPEQISAVIPDQEEDFTLELPEDYVPLCTDHVSFDAKRARTYLARRHVNEKQIIQHKIGYAKRGPYRDRIILPSFDGDGRLNFFTARTVCRDPRKYLNPEVPQGYKQTIVLNELNLDWLRPIHIVEGFMDMLCVDNAVPLFGSTLPRDSKLLFNLVLNDSRVYVCLDADAWDKQCALLKSLTSYGVSCYDVHVWPYKDVAEMPPEVLAQKQSEADGADRISVLRARIRNL